MITKLVSEDAADGANRMRWLYRPTTAERLMFVTVAGLSWVILFAYCSCVIWLCLTKDDLTANSNVIVVATAGLICTMIGSAVFVTWMASVRIPTRRGEIDVQARRCTILIGRWYRVTFGFDDIEEIKVITQYTGLTTVSYVCLCSKERYFWIVLSVFRARAWLSQDEVTSANEFAKGLSEVVNTGWQGTNRLTDACHIFPMT